MLLSIPFLVERIKIEISNKSYEVSVPYSDIEALHDAGVPTDQIFKKLRNANVESLSFNPLSLFDLENRGLIQLVTKAQILQHIDKVVLPKEKGIWIELLDPQHVLVNAIPEAINSNYKNIIKVRKYKFADKEFLFIPYGTKLTLAQSISFDMDAIHEALSYKFSIVPRLSNDFNDEDEQHPLFRQMQQLKNHFNHIIFIGEEIVGFSNNNDTQRIEKMADRINGWNKNVVLIENSNQRGFQELVPLIGKKLIRLHSMTLGKEIPQQTNDIYRGARAVNERNIQLLYINILNKNPLEFYQTPSEAQDTLKGTIDFLEKLDEEIDKIPAVAEPFSSFTQPVWLKVTMLIVAAAFIGLTLGTFQKKWLVPSFLLTLSVSVIFAMFLQTSILTKLIVLTVAVLAPVYAIRTMLSSSRRGSLSFLKGLGITLTGGWIVVFTLYGWEYLVHIDSFRGVKILALLPVIIVWMMVTGMGWLNNNIRYRDIMIFVILIGVGLFYISRTGNGGLTIPFEMSFRQALENILGVRPRTKEFLLGIPFLIFGVYLVRTGYEWGKYFYIIGTIAFSSIIGTFTHLHTPLLISLYRTGLSIILGIGLGGLFIMSWNFLNKFFIPTKERFSSWKL